MTVRRISRAILIILAGCGAESTSTDRVMVFAAASLTAALESLAAEFEARHPATDVVVSLAGSNQLALQISQGAPADVFVSADPTWMTYLVDRNLIETPQPIGRNRLVIAVPESNPGHVETWADLGRPGLLVVRAAPEVPAGRYADAAIARLADRPDAPPDYAARVARNIVSLEESVKGVVGKLLLGEADAGFVYRTDVTHTSRLRALALPDDIGTTADYLIARTRESTLPTAYRFIAFVRSDAGQDVLRRYGFTAAGDQVEQ